MSIPNKGWELEEWQIIKLIFLNSSFRNVATLNAGVNEILIHRLNDPEKYEFYDILKSFMMQGDNWIMLQKEVLPENHIVIMDIGVYTLKMVARTNIFYFQKFAIYLLVSESVIWILLPSFLIVIWIFLSTILYILPLNSWDYLFLYIYEYSKYDIIIRC